MDQGVLDLEYFSKIADKTALVIESYLLNQVVYNQQLLGVNNCYYRGSALKS